MQNTPRQQKKALYKASSVARRGKKSPHIFSKTTKIASAYTELYSIARRNAAIHLALLPTKIRQFERILGRLQRKNAVAQGKNRHTKLRRAMAKQARSARRNHLFLSPQAAHAVFCPFFARKRPVLRHKPRKTSAFHAGSSPSAQARDHKALSARETQHFS